MSRLLQLLVGGLLVFSLNASKAQYSIGVPVLDSLAKVQAFVTSSDTNCYKYEVKLDPALNNYLTGVDVMFVITNVSEPNCLYRLGKGFINQNDTSTVGKNGSIHRLSAACPVEFTYEVIVHGTPQVMEETYFCDPMVNSVVLQEGCQQVLSHEVFSPSNSHTCAVNNDGHVEPVENDLEIIQTASDLMIKSHSTGKMAIYDVNGNAIYSNKGHNAYVVPIERFAKGLYVVKMYSFSGRQSFSKMVAVE